MCFLTNSNSWRRTHPSSKSRNKFCTKGLTPMLFIQLRKVFSSRVSSRFGNSSSAGSIAGKLLNRLQTNARFSLAFPFTISLARTNLRHFILTALASTSSASFVGSDTLKCGWSTPRWEGAIWQGKGYVRTYLTKTILKETDGRNSNVLSRQDQSEGRILISYT